MKRSLVLASVGIIGLFVACGRANAFTYQLTCGNTGTDHLQASLQGTSNWTTPASLAQVAPGDLVELTGVCQGDIVMQTAAGVPISGVTIANRLGNNTFNGGTPDGINGQVEIRNAQLLLEGIEVVGTAVAGSDVANVYVHDSGQLKLDGVDVLSAPLTGVYILRGSSAVMLNSFVAGSGTSDIAKETDNIRVELSSSLVLGKPDDSQATNVAFAANGNGITLVSGSSAELYGASIHDDAAAEIEVLGASNVYLNAVNLATTGTARPVIEVFGSSNLLLAGGNNICASSAANSCVALSGGTAIEIDHSSSLAQQSGPALGYAAATEQITGAGAIQEQSSIDLGQGTSSAVSWSLSGSEIVNVQQNSSFRLSGGVSITGGNGVKIQQGSNGFFNLNNGGTNTATIVCTNTANNPMAHISNPGSVSPGATTFNLNDVLAGDSGAAHPGQTNACLNF